MSGNSVLRYSIIVALGIALVAFMFPDVLFNPGTTLLSNYGDAPKNYYTFIYHALHGEGTHFVGMNYPYGEHIIFADAQPLLAWFSSLLYDLFRVSPLTTLHLLILTSYTISVAFLTKLLWRFKVGVYIAPVFAILITIMSPQLFKLTGHYSLSYVCIIPLLFYVTVAYHQTVYSKYLFYLLLITIVTAFIHLYFLAMVVLWVFFYCISLFLSHIGKWRYGFRKIIPFAAAHGIALLIFAAFLYSTDTVADRPDYPSNTRSHTTALKDIVTSAYSPVWIWLKDGGVIEKIGGRSEGYTYIGLIPTLFFIIAIYTIMLSLFKHRRLSYDNNGSSVTELWPWIFIGGAMLFIGTAVMFIYCFECQDNAMLFRQFRAIGRFSWVFYYVATVIATVVLYSSYTLLVKRSKIVAISLMAVTIVIWSIESSGYIKFSRVVSSLAKENYQEYNSLKTDWAELFDNKLNSDSFQAILNIPYIHVGSEKLGAGYFATGNLKNTFAASLITGLPMMDVMMSRTSWSQTFDQVKITAGPYVQKPALSVLNDERSIMLVKASDYTLSEDEKYLLQFADSLGKVNNSDIYSLSPNALNNNVKDTKASIQSLVRRFPAIQDTILYSDKMYRIQHFKSNMKKPFLFGNGAQDAVTGAYGKVTTFEFKPFLQEDIYEVSLWVLVPDDNYRIPAMDIHCFYQSDSIISRYRKYGVEANDNSGMWLRLSRYITIPEGCSKINVSLMNLPTPSYYAVDEVVLRPINGVTISKDEKHYMVNNHLGIL